MMNFSKSLQSAPPPPKCFCSSNEVVSLQTPELLILCDHCGCKNITFRYYKNITFDVSGEWICSSAARCKYFVDAPHSHLSWFLLYLGKAKELC